MSVVIERVDETEVFFNQGGGVTIQQNDHPNEPTMICFPVSCIPAMIAALRAVEQEASGK